MSDKERITRLRAALYSVRSFRGRPAQIADEALLEDDASSSWTYVAPSRARRIADPSDLDVEDEDGPTPQIPRETMQQLLAGRLR